jgi:hypothetical protein
MHVVPLDDIVEHVDDGFVCVCCPHVEQLTNGDVMVVHYALDGRCSMHPAEKLEMN